MAICITGTPGTGKSTLGKILAKELKYKLIDINKIVKEEKLYESYDKKDQSFVVDIKKLNKFLKEVLKYNKEAIIDSHLSHFLPKRSVELCVITKCGLKELKNRLEKRKYPKEKVRENLDSEIFDICLNEAKERGHNVFVINTTKGISKEEVTQLRGELDGIKSSCKGIK